ncbi:MAG: ATP synthase F0 subunit B [Flammeovirgaceae bacterium TMED32]|nr:MAG: ATP synthase F0 subunit B [Flammeovirgaceae bacterium TMED32]
MDLLIPDYGLLFWQLIVFSIVLTILAIFVWKPVTEALRTRESMIEDSIKSAELAREEMMQIKADNAMVLKEASVQRDQLLKDATIFANKIKDDAKSETSKISEKMILDAKSIIEGEKNAALSELKNLVSTLSLDIAEKLIREKLNNDPSQQQLVEKFLKEVKVN